MIHPELKEKQKTNSIPIKISFSLENMKKNGVHSLGIYKSHMKFSKLIENIKQCIKKCLRIVIYLPGDAGYQCYFRLAIDIILII